MYPLLPTPETKKNTIWNLKLGNITQDQSLSWEDFPRGGHDNPLQCSCLQNPMDRGAWQAIVHRIAKSWTRLKRLSTQARTSDHQALSPRRWEPWSYRIFCVAPILVHVWGVMLVVSSRLSFYGFCTCFQRARA